MLISSHCNSQDTHTRERVAFKVSTKPLVVMCEEIPFPEPGTEEFNSALEMNSWEYRCGKPECCVCARTI